MKKFVSLALALALALSGLVFTAQADEIKDFRDYQLVSAEMATFCYQYSQSSAELKPLSSCFDHLLTNGTDGALLPAVATDWSSEDGGKTWTFTLRDDVTWVDYQGNYKADVIAEDFATGLEWVLNYYKNQAANTSMPIQMIEGAGEYYEYTKTLDEAEAKALKLDKFYEMVGVSVPDDTTIVFTCLAPLAYFPTVTTYNCLAPLSAKLIDEVGVDAYFGADNTTLWYNGPYIMTEYVQGNEKIFTKNESYYNKDAKLFDTVTVKMIDDLNTAFTMFTQGELDHVDLTESEIAIIAGNPSNEWYDYMVPTPVDIFSYNWKFNFNKCLEDGTPDVNWNTAVANEAFRKSIYYGLDLTDYLARTNSVDPLSVQNYTYTMRGLVVNSEGVDYTQLVMDELGMTYEDESFSRYDAEAAAAYKAQAIEELTAQGVTFPVELDWYIAGSNQVAKDTADVLTQMFNDYLGADYIQFTTKTYVSSYANEVRKPKLQSLAESGWAADYGDPINFLSQEILDDDNAFFATTYANANEAQEPALSALAEFTALVNEAAAINDDIDARYVAFAKAEAYYLEHALCIPTRVNRTWQLTAVNDYSKIYVLYGVQQERYVGWETNSDLYTVADYAELAK